MTNIQDVEHITGINYPYRETINAYMFSEGGYVRSRLIGGRGRAVRQVDVHYHTDYPIDLINQVLKEVKLAHGSIYTYSEWIQANAPKIQWGLPPKRDRLTEISDIVAHYIDNSKDTRNWTVANELLKELTEVFEVSNEQAE